MYRKRFPKRRKKKKKKDEEEEKEEKGKKRKEEEEEEKNVGASKATPFNLSVVKQRGRGGHVHASRRV